MEIGSGNAEVGIILNEDVGKWQSAECIVHRVTVEVRGLTADDITGKSKRRNVSIADFRLQIADLRKGLESNSVFKNYRKTGRGD